MSRHRSTAIRLYTPKVEVDDLETRLRSLIPLAATPISSLSGDGLANFEFIKKHLQTEHYTLVKKSFSGVIPVPGTVGGYLAGCVNDQQFSQAPGCAVSCVNAFQSPHSSQCQVRVYQTTLTGQGYVFHLLNNGVATIHHQAYIYVDAYSLNTFRGFTVAEKNILKVAGVTEVAIISPRQPNGEYIDLMDGFVPIDDLPEAINPVIPTQSSNPWAGVGIFILIILIFIFLLWASRNPIGLRG